MFKINDRVRLKHDNKENPSLTVRSEVGGQRFLCISDCGQRMVWATTHELELVESNFDLKQAIREVLLSEQFLREFAKAFVNTPRPSTIQAWSPITGSESEAYCLQKMERERQAEQSKGFLNSDTIPEGYRELNDSSEEPRQLGDLRWSVAVKRYVEISVDEIGYANRDNWAACRKIEPSIKQSLTPEPPDGCRPNDNVALAMQMATSRFGRKVGVFNAANFSNAIRQLAGVECTLDGHVVATILGGRSDVEVLKGGSHYRYLFYESISSSKERVEPPKQQTTPKPPDGWRFLEEGEVIRKGDKPIFPGGEIKELKPAAIGKKHERPCRAYCHYIRRNRFEVGEKVVHGFGDRQSISVVESILGDGWVDLGRDGVSTAYHVNDLAPYIEDTK